MKGVLLKLGKLMSVRMLAIGLTFIQTIVITRVFGSEVFGLFSFALSISALTVLVVSVGLDQVIMRDIAKVGISQFVKSNRYAGIKSVIKFIVIPIVLLASALGYFVVTYTSVAGHYVISLVAIFISLPFVVLRKYAEAISQGAKKIINSILGSQVVYPCLMIASCFYILRSGISPSTTAISYSYFFAVVCSCFSSIFLMLASVKVSRIEKNELKSPESKCLKHTSEISLIRSGVHFSLVSLGFVIGQHIDVLLLGIMSTPEQVAIVRIAARIAEMVGLMRAIILLQYKPLLAESYSNSDLVKLQQHVFVMAKIFAATGLPLAILLWIFADQAMLVFGSEFVSGNWTMRIYVSGVLVTLLMGPANAVLAMTGNESTASKILLIALMIQIALDLILIPFLGSLGCAIASFLSMCFLGSASRLKVKKEVQIETSIIGYFLGAKR